jgi:hypothetical protein
MLNWRNRELRRPVLELIYYQLEPDYLARSSGHKTPTTNDVDISLKHSLDPILARDVYAVLFPSTGLLAWIAKKYNSMRENVASDFIIGITGMFFFYWDKEDR